MTPAFPIHDCGYGAMVDAKGNLEFGLRDPELVKITNADYIGFRKFGSPATLSLGAIVTSLFNHIGHVVLRVSLKEVIWINAGRIVTLVQNVQKRLSSVCKLPRVAMGFVIPLVYIETAITCPIMSASPHPAWTKFRDKSWAFLIDFRPKSFAGVAYPSSLYPANRFEIDFHLSPTILIPLGKVRSFFRCHVINITTVLEVCHPALN